MVADVINSWIRKSGGAVEIPAKRAHLLSVVEAVGVEVIPNSDERTRYDTRIVTCKRTC